MISNAPHQALLHLFADGVQTYVLSATTALHDFRKIVPPLVFRGVKFRNFSAIVSSAGGYTQQQRCSTWPYFRASESLFRASHITPLPLRQFAFPFLSPGGRIKRGLIRAATPSSYLIHLTCPPSPSYPRSLLSPPRSTPPLPAVRGRFAQTTNRLLSVAYRQRVCVGTVRNRPPFTRNIRVNLCPHCGMAQRTRMSTGKSAVARTKLPYFYACRDFRLAAPHRPRSLSRMTTQVPAAG